MLPSAFHSDTIPNHKPICISLEQRQASFQNLLLGVDDGHFLISKQLLVALEDQSFIEFALGSEELDYSVLFVGGTNNHAIGLEASQRSGLEVDHHQYITSHLLKRHMLLQTRRDLSHLSKHFNLLAPQLITFRMLHYHTKDTFQHSLISPTRISICAKSYGVGY